MSSLQRCNAILIEKLQAIFPEEDFTRNTFGNEPVSSPEVSVSFRTSEAASSSKPADCILEIRSDDPEYALDLARATHRIASILNKVIGGYTATASAVLFAAQLKKASEVAIEQAENKQSKSSAKRSTKQASDAEVVVNCFVWMDKNLEWVPKVIDEKSYQVALALRDYFAMIREENILDFSIGAHSKKLTDAVKEALKNLDPIQELLIARITAYQVMIQDFAEKRNILQQKVYFEDRLNQMIRALQAPIDKLKTGVSRCRVAPILTDDEIAELEQRISEIQREYSDPQSLSLEQSASEFARCVDEWMSEVSSTQLCINRSNQLFTDMINDLRFGENYQAANKIRDIINTGISPDLDYDKLRAEIAIAPPSQKDALREKLLLAIRRNDVGTELLDHAHAQILKSKGLRQVEIEAELKVLALHEEKLNAVKFVVARFKHYSPEFGFPESVVYEYSESANEIEKAKASIAQVEQFLANYKQQREIIIFNRQAFEREVAIPDGKHPCELVIRKQREGCLAIYEEQLKKADDIIAQYEAEKNRLVSELALHDTETRTIRIAELQAACKAAEREWEEAQAASHRYGEQYEADRDITNEALLRILQIQIAVEKACQTAVEAAESELAALAKVQDALKAKQAKLTAFREAVDPGAGSLYNAFANVSRNELHELLELDLSAEKDKAIDELYDAVERENARYGFNLNYISQFVSDKPTDSLDNKYLVWSKAGEKVVGNERQLKELAKQIQAIKLQRNEAEASLATQKADLQSAQASLQQQLQNSLASRDTARQNALHADIQHQLLQYRWKTLEFSNLAIEAEQAHHQLQTLVDIEPSGDIWEPMISCERLMDVCDAAQAMKHDFNKALDFMRATLEHTINMAPLSTEKRAEFQSQLAELNGQRYELADLSIQHGLWYVLTVASNHHEAIHQNPEQTQQFITGFQSFIDEHVTNQERKELYQLGLNQHQHDNHRHNDVVVESENNEQPVPGALADSENNVEPVSVSSQQADPQPRPMRRLAKNLEEYYSYGLNPRLSGIKKHSHEASTNRAFYTRTRFFQRSGLDMTNKGFTCLTDEERGYTGDRLKAAILARFKDAIERCPDREAVNRLENGIKNHSLEYMIIKTSQDRFTNLFGKTDSLKAFEQMLTDKRRQLRQEPVAGLQVVNN